MNNPGLPSPGRSLPAGISALAACLTALAIGLSLVLQVFPHWALTGGLPLAAPPRRRGRVSRSTCSASSISWRSHGLPAGQDGS